MLDFAHFDPSEPALYLDDERTPEPTPYFTWVVVRSHHAFVEYIEQHGLPRFLSFDHDLGAIRIHQGNPPLSQDPAYLPLPTGMDSAKWLVNYCLDHDVLAPDFTVHSANPGGGENILHLLNNLRFTQGLPSTGHRYFWPFVTGISFTT
jgi:hypothetical protein